MWIKVKNKYILINYGDTKNNFLYGSISGGINNYFTTTPDKIKSTKINTNYQCYYYKSDFFYTYNKRKFIYFICG